MPTETFTVALTDRDVEVARLKAKQRVRIAYERGAETNAYGGKNNDHRPEDVRMENGVLGELGEIAVSRHFGLPTTSYLGDYGASDLPNGIEVRATSHPRGGLPLHDHDKDDHRYVLVIVRMQEREAELIGWLHARDGKLPAWRMKPYPDRPAFYRVGRNHLHPIGSLFT